MNLLVVSDIFGNTKPLNEFVAHLSSFYCKITVIDPYGGQYIQFSSEEDAYKYFQMNCGIKQLTELLAEEIEKSKHTVDIIGFSVGGTAAWEISSSETTKSIRTIVCFYSSRIRNNTSITPRFPTTVIFPEFEKSFELEPVIQAVEKNTNVEVIRTNYLHGFMNKKSENYSEAGYKYFLSWLANRSSVDSRHEFLNLLTPRLVRRINHS